MTVAKVGIMQNKKNVTLHYPRFFLFVGRWSRLLFGKIIMPTFVAENQ